MARHFALRSYRNTIFAPNQPQALITDILLAQGHQKTTGAFRVFSDGGNAGVMALGGPNVTVNMNADTDGEPISAGSFSDIGISPRVEAITSEIDLQQQYIVGTVAGDEYYVTYLAIVD